MKILFLMRSLDYGGTERQLVELAKGLDSIGHSVKVLEFYSGGALEKDLQIAQVPFHSLAKRGRWDIIPFFHKLVLRVKYEKPQVLYAFLGVPCIISIFLKPFFPQTKVVWGVRSATMDLSRYDWLYRYAYRLECFLSRFADLVIANSTAGKKYGIEHGFPQNIEVIPNGVNVDQFRPYSTVGQEIRKKWNVKDNEILIGQVARLDPMKDYHTFLAAASLVASKRPDVRFVCVGSGPAVYSLKLREEAETYGLGNRIIWAGERNDMPAIYSSLDLLVSSSYGESFSNVIAEAMACGVPCVVTNVGDSARIVGETGIIIPPQNPEALADGIIFMLNKTEFIDGTLHKTCRQRITEKFSVVRLVENTVAVFERLRCTE